MDVKRTAPDTANSKKQDSDVLHCVNAVADAQTSVKAIFFQKGGFLFILSICFSYFSESTSNLQANDGHIWNISFFNIRKKIKFAID